MTPRTLTQDESVKLWLTLSRACPTFQGLADFANAVAMLDVWRTPTMTEEDVP